MEVLNRVDRLFANGGSDQPKIIAARITAMAHIQNHPAFSAEIDRKFEIHEWGHAIAIMKTDFPREWKDVTDVLERFRLCQSWIIEPGGRKSKVSAFVDQFLYDRGWQEKSFEISMNVDLHERELPTHSVDCYKNRIALEIEWNNKDPFYDRDLNNFRLLFDLRTISVGIIITRCDVLQGIFDRLGRGDSYGASTTHLSKLLPRIEGGGAGGCPLLVFGIDAEAFDAAC